MIKFIILSLILIFTAPLSAMAIKPIIRYRILDIIGFGPISTRVAQRMELQRLSDREKSGLEFRKKYLKESLTAHEIIAIEAKIIQLKEQSDAKAVELCNFFLSVDELNKAEAEIEGEIHNAARWAELVRGCPLLMPEHIEHFWVESKPELLKN
jgi:hypothetical protein